MVVFFLFFLFNKKRGMRLLSSLILFIEEVKEYSK